MSTDSSPTAAERACGEYEHWASEVRRLTDAIGAVQCPREIPDDDWNARTSHFAEAADVRIVSGAIPGHDMIERRLTLDEIEQRVGDCWHCRDLVTLIRARRYARKQFGIAKRRVRTVGKRVVREQRTGSER